MEVGRSTLSSGDEIVLIDFTPRRVFVERLKVQEVHYFFWNLDLYKPFDYEPVKVEKRGDGVYVSTRYHWRGLVMWTSPKLHDEKPLLTIAHGVHTPIIYSTRWLFHLICDMKALSASERFMLGAYITIFNALLTGKLSINDQKKFKGYKELITYEAVPEEYRFRLDKWSFLIIIGGCPKTMPEEVRSRLEGHC
ncbi:hypothetical protein KEJ51_01240 [Candidatus Bathyarchaeota archaeon]|nr:hypothetical protein [Candidatus Bathyarchaeota archaeon]MBS7628462.1 hypothetical protein [Candidatus Bathyarchaeota archaeon]